MTSSGMCNVKKNRRKKIYFKGDAQEVKVILDLSIFDDSRSIGKIFYRQTNKMFINEYFINRKKYWIY